MPSAASILGISTTSNNMPDGSARSPVQVLGQDDFLKLLVTQMQQQDPMNPQKDTEFIAQMASFSALEQSKTMQQDMAQLRAGSLLGDTVTVKGLKNTTFTGVVESVEFSNGKPSLIIGGVPYEMSDVLTVKPTVTQPLPAIAANPASSQTTN
ncbi:MAG: flagellar hook capping protein [Verrucomicrobia bacterium]|nr:flagellar hook capping protein [Verrucomicrobiota bacterium]